MSHIGQGILDSNLGSDDPVQLVSEYVQTFSAVDRVIQAGYATQLFQGDSGSVQRCGQVGAGLAFALLYWQKEVYACLRQYNYEAGCTIGELQ